MKTVFITILFCLFLNQKLSAQTNVPGGNVSGLWTLSGSPYLIQGHIIVPDNNTLTIEPGVVIEFQGHYKLFCNGRILALGTQSQMITFTTTVANISAGWAGIRYDQTPSTNDTSKFIYCSIQYGKATGTGNDLNGGGFYFNYFSKCIIDHCTISNNYAYNGGGAISVWYSSPKILFNSFFNNTSDQGGNGIQMINSNSIVDHNSMINSGGIMFYYTPVTIINNYIRGSMQGAVTCFSADGSLIKNNIFENNINNNGGGGGAILLHNSTAIVTHNVIRNNSTNFMGGGITCFTYYAAPSTTATIIANNLFHNNISGSAINGQGNGGGAIALYNNSPRIVNNTICDNYSSLNGGGIYCISNSDPSVYNCIFYNNNAGGNGNNIYLDDNNSDPGFVNCDIQGGLNGINTNGNPFTGAFSNNIDVLPDFTDASLGNYSLLNTSPCLDAGNADTTGLSVSNFDLSGGPRIVNGIIDIGAYEGPNFVNLNSFAAIDNTNIFYPNPSSEKIYFLDEIKSIRIFDVMGRKIETNAPESNSLTISSLEAGSYFIMVETKNGVSNNILIKE